MARREDEPNDGKWYAIGYTYKKQQAMESYILITSMNNMVKPKYDIKIIAIKEKDWLEGYGASWQEPKAETDAEVEGERTSPKDEELPTVIPDTEKPETEEGTGTV